MNTGKLHSIENTNARMLYAASEVSKHIAYINHPMEKTAQVKNQMEAAMFVFEMRLFIC